MANAAKTSLSSGLDALADIEAHHPRRDELVEDGRHRGSTRYRCGGSSVARMFQVPSLGTTHIGHVPAMPAPLTGYRALAFHTLLSFQGASWNRPCDSPGGSPRRSRRRSGGNRTLGLPGSSTEQPIPWFLRGYPPSRCFVPVRRRLKPPMPFGSYRRNVGSSAGVPREPLPWPPQVRGVDSSEPNPEYRYSEPLAPPRQHVTQKRRPVPFGSGRPP